MSDGSISQDEIDALLSGIDMGGEAQPKPATVAKTGASDFKKDAFDKFLVNPIKAFEASLGSMIGGQAEIKSKSYSDTDREAFMQIVPELVVASTCDFAEGLTGDHLFIMPHKMVSKIVGLVNHEEKAEIDDMALSIVSEVVGQILGAEMTEFDNIGLKRVVHNPPEAMNVPKAMIRLPQKSFMNIAYEITIGGENFTYWEVLSDEVATTIAETIQGKQAPTPAQQAKPNVQAKTPAQQTTQAQPQMQQTFTGGTSMDNFGQINTGMQSQNIQSAGANPSVQPVTYPQLQSFEGAEIKNNIGLIMDVLMELTVELGRTKKTVKEILGMGEGHIISLDKLAGESVDILVNHKPIAKGEVVVIEENFGVRVTEIISPADRANNLTK
ncbi:MAG: flagellar motor switch protein FliN [Treponemataceae bacterium]